MENIIDFSKIESDKMEIVNVSYNPKKIFEELAKINELNIEDKPITLHTSIAKDLPYELIGDKVHVKQIVNNILTNAIKYTDKGSIELDVSSVKSKTMCRLIIKVIDTPFIIFDNLL